MWRVSPKQEELPSEPLWIPSMRPFTANCALTCKPAQEKRFANRAGIGEKKQAELKYLDETSRKELKRPARPN